MSEKNILKIKKLHEEAVLPNYATAGDAGLDFTATEIEFEDKYVQCRTGISVEVPEGHVGLLFPRSSISNKDLVLANSVGVVDSGYRGEIVFRFKICTEEDKCDLIEVCDHCNGYGALDVEDTNEEIPCPVCSGSGEVLGIELYSIGDKIGQMIILPYPKFIVKEVDQLSGTERGAKGFGSTDKADK